MNKGASKDIQARLQFLHMSNLLHLKMPRLFAIHLWTPETVLKVFLRTSMMPERNVARHSSILVAEEMLIGTPVQNNAKDSAVSSEDKICVAYQKILGLAIITLLRCTSIRKTADVNNFITEAAKAMETALAQWKSARIFVTLGKKLNLT